MAMTMAQMQARLDALEARNAELEEAVTKRSTITLQVSQKGALSVYGLGRFPVTLYKGQWKRLIEVIPDIESYMVKNDAKLQEKAPRSGSGVVAK